MEEYLDHAGAAAHKAQKQRVQACRRSPPVLPSCRKHISSRQSDGKERHPQPLNKQCDFDHEMFPLGTGTPRVEGGRAIVPMENAFGCNW